MFKQYFRGFICIVSSLLIIHSSAKAQSTSDLLDAELRSEVKNSLSAVLNGLVIFGSSSAVGSGLYEFDGDDSPDTELNVLRLFNDFEFESENEKVTPFVNLGIGQAKLTEEIPPIEGTGQNDFSTVVSNSIGLGLGADIKLTDNWTLTPVFDIAYSHNESNYDFNNEFSQTILALFDGNFVNWDVDTMSYDPAIKLAYDYDMGCGVKLLPSVRYTQIFVDSISSNSDLIDVSSSSGILSSKIRAEVNDLVSIGDQNLTLVPQLNRTDIYRDARSGLGIHYFHELALGVIAKNQTTIPFFKDFGISGGWTFGEDMSGWRIGIEADI